MTISKIISASIVLLGAIYTAINLATGGEPSPLTAALAVVGVVQYAVLE